MADTADLKSAGIRCEGSSPFPGTKGRGGIGQTHRILIPAIGGSSPLAPAIIIFKGDAEK